MQCWGRDGYGEASNTQAEHLLLFLQGTHIVDDSGSVQCWGRDDRSVSNTPVELFPLFPVVIIILVEAISGIVQCRGMMVVV